MESSVVDTSLGPVEFALQGEGPPVLISHGAAGGFDQGLLVAAPLSSQGYQLLAPSRDGYLRSPLSSASSPRSQAEKYALLLDHLQIDSCATLAVSAGAPAAIEFALNYPERCEALVLVSSIISSVRPAYLGFLPQGLLVTMMGSPAYRLLRVRAPDSTLLAALGVSTQDRRRAPLDRQTASALQQVLLAARDPLGLRTEGVVADIKSTGSLRRYPFATVDIPALAVHGSADRFAPLRPVEAAIAALPHGKLEVIAGAGHLGIITHGHAVFPAVVEFLQKSLH